MGHMGVPWAVGGGAQNSEGLARMLANFMFGGQQGIVNATDCQVKALATPGTSVRVMPGAYNITARGSGQLYESYIGKLESEDVIPISPTTAGSGRSDLVIIRVEDPNVSGEPWQEPVNPQEGPYVFTRVIENVPSTTRTVTQLGNNFSAITLARIDIPASTGTITQGMIKDLRGLMNPVAGPAPEPQIPCPPDEPAPEVTEKLWTDARQGSGYYTTGSSRLFPTPVNVWQNWPSQGDWVIPVPPWATGADIFCQINNAQYPQNAWGEMRINIGNGTVYTPAFMYDINDSYGGPGDQRFPMTIAATVMLPSNLRNKNIRFRTEARPLANEGSTVNFDRASSIYMQVNFKQFPIAG